MRRQKSGSFGFAKGWLAGGAKPNVPLAGWLKLFLKNVRWEINKKHRVGNECRLTRCPFVISFLCLWSPVKMVYFFLVFSRLFAVARSPLHLLPTLRICLVADCGRFNCQTVVKFERAKSLAKCNKTAIRYMRCYAAFFILIVIIFNQFRQKI